jgi:Bifunctional DNA primase/polymerase, N-terminal
MTENIKIPSAVKTAANATKRGWHFFPIKPGKKHPPLVTDNLDTGATNDPAVIATWAQDCNVGVALAKSHLIVLDIDVRDGKRGLETLNALIAKHGPLPPTLTVRTPSGGFHYYFRETNGVKHRMSTTAFGAGVESTNYVLLPGSVLFDGKKFSGRYVTIDKSPVADAPAWFGEYLKERTPTVDDCSQAPVVEQDTPEIIKRAIEYLKTDAKPSLQGENGEYRMLLTYAVLKDMGVSLDAAIQLVEEHYNLPDKCVPQWACGEGADADRHDIKARNAWKYLNQNAPGALSAEADFTADPPEPLTPEEETQQENIRAGNRMVVRNESYGERKRVVIVTGNDHNAIAAVQKIVGPQIDLPDPVFKRNGKLVRLSRNLAEGGSDLKHFEKDALVIQDITKPWFTTRATKSCNFGYPKDVEVKTPIVGEDGKPVSDAKGKPTFSVTVERRWVPMNFPPRIVDQVLGDSSNWPLYRTLYSTTETPTLRPDGTILDSPGYDKGTGLFYDPGDVKFPPIPSRPSKAAGVEAMKLIDDVLIDFPFDPKNTDEKDRNISKAVAVSMLLTSVVRRTLDIAPAYGIDADDQEAGKTTLAKVAGALAVGRNIAVQAFSKSEEERDKLLSALLLTAAPVILFDNIDDIIEGRTIEAVITSAMFDSRPFGKNDTVRTAPTNALTIFTGNKISVGGTLASRVLVSRLVPDKPFKSRTFKHRDIVAYVIAERPKLVAAILTALRCYLIHGKKVVKDTDRFPPWSDLIRSAVIWYGYADPQRGGDKLRENDPIKEAQREVLRQWWKIYTDKSVTAVELRDRSETRDAFADGLKIKSADVTSFRISPYIEKMIDVKLGMPVTVVKEGKRPGRSQQFHLELAKGVRPDWLDKEDDVPAGDDFGGD